MRADLFTFFENGDRDILIQLSKVIGGGEAGWPSPDNHHIDFKSFAFLHSGRIAEMGLYSASYSAAMLDPGYLDSALFDFVGFVDGEQ